MKRRFSTLVAAASLCLASQAVAEGPEPFPDFTFKRVKIPSSNAGKRITIQIDSTSTSTSTVVKPPKPSPPQPGLFDWYWAAVSPSLTATGAARLEIAVNSLTQGPNGSAVPTPRVQDLQNIASEHGTEILKATIGTRVSPALVLALIGIESAGQTDAISRAGASGLMQLMPATAERFGVSDRTDAADNIRGGVAYLDWLMQEFDGDPVIILAAYNAGENSVKKHDGVPPFAETRAYVPKVLAAWTVARGLCVTPPQLVSDGCVFASKGAPGNG